MSSAFAIAGVTAFLMDLLNDGLINGDISSVTGGNTWGIGGDAEFGVIAAAGYSNTWQTKEGPQQLSGGASVGPDGGEILKPDQDYRFVSTESWGR